jgi:hypothetical protein
MAQLHPGFQIHQPKFRGKSAIVKKWDVAIFWVNDTSRQKVWVVIIDGLRA